MFALIRVPGLIYTGLMIYLAIRFVSDRSGLHDWAFHSIAFLAGSVFLVAGGRAFALFALRFDGWKMWPMFAITIGYLLFAAHAFTSRFELLYSDELALSITYSIAFVASGILWVIRLDKEPSGPTPFSRARPARALVQSPARSRFQPVD